MPDDKSQTGRGLLILAGQIWTNKSSSLLGVTTQVSLSFMNPSRLSITSPNFSP